MPISFAGPYDHRGKWRYRVKEAPGVYHWAPPAPTKAEALELAEIFADGLRARVDLTVGGVVGAYLEHLQRNDRKPQTITAVRGKLWLLLESRWDADAASITEQRAKDIYLQLVPRRAAATHHEAISQARACWAWAVEERIVRSNPWTAVRKQGRPRRGKPQLTLDETRKLMDHCLLIATESDGALATLLAILCGLRVSEIVGLTPRSLDDGGKRLRIQASKTAAGKRDPQIPDIIQPLLTARAAGRAHDAPLLVAATQTTLSGRRNWVRHEVERLCADAGVPIVCPHALRGGLASLAYEAGALPHLIAGLLGHTSSSMTERHYATPEAVQGALQRQRIESLLGTRRPN